MKGSLVIRRPVLMKDGTPWLQDDGWLYPVLDEKHQHFADLQQEGVYSLNVDTLANTTEPWCHAGQHHPLFVTLHPQQQDSQPFAYYGTSVHEISAFIDNPYLTVDVTPQGEQLFEQIRFKHTGLLHDKLYWLLGHLSTDFWYHLTSQADGEYLSVKPTRDLQDLVPVLKLHFATCQDLALAYSRFQRAVQTSWSVS